MNIKRAFFFCSLLLIVLSGLLYAEQQGKLSVFTDVKEAEIYVDSEKIGQDNVVGYPLSSGEHYLKVMYQGKKAYAEVVNIVAGQTKTVVVDNFVDFKTNAPSRGAVDKEAARLRETRGNMAFGIYGGAPASGLSYKWWVFEKFGFQVSGFTQSPVAEIIDNQFGYRVLFGFADKVYMEDTITAYAALGRGRSGYTNKKDSDDNIFMDTTEASFGLELRLGRPGNSGPSYGGVIDSMGDIVLLGLQMVSMGIINTCYMSLEVGAESRNVEFGDHERKDESLTNMKVSGGIHYYF